MFTRERNGSQTSRQILLSIANLQR
jgi:hypothetical protein